MRKVVRDKIAKAIREKNEGIIISCKLNMHIDEVITRMSNKFYEEALEFQLSIIVYQRNKHRTPELSKQKVLLESGDVLETMIATVSNLTGMSREESLHSIIEHNRIKYNESGGFEDCMYLEFSAKEY